MPANQKYLTASSWARFSKISAGFLGGYLLSMSFHLALAQWLPHPVVLITSTFSGFLLWAVLMVLAFLFEKPWKLWALYLGGTFLFGALLYLGKLYSPIL